MAIRKKKITGIDIKPSLLSLWEAVWGAAWDALFRAAARCLQAPGNNRHAWRKGQSL